MAETESLDNLKIDQSCLKERRPQYLRNVKVKIFLDPKQKEKARKNGLKIPIKINPQEVYKAAGLTHKPSYYRKVEESAAKKDDTKKV